MGAEKYPRHIVKGFTPYDPLWLARRTESIVCSGDSRKYTAFYCTGVYGGISTGYLVGCCLRCAFCWVDPSRDFPETYGEMHSPGDVARKLISNARRSGVSKLRISGGEPTLGRAHLLALLRSLKDSGYGFILETNGMLLGDDPSYVSSLGEFRNVHVRVSIKAGTPSGFEGRTGAVGRYYDLPFRAVEYLMREGVSFHVACMSDPRLMDSDERGELLRILRDIGYRDYLEEELCDPYPNAVSRLEAAGFRLFPRGS
ncbi:MAG: radical SAM protein [bacterium]